MADIIEVIKKASQEAEDQRSPCNVLFGTVINISPLEIQVEQKLVLTKEFLILTKNVIDYNIQVGVNWNTNNKELNADHSHSAVGDATIQNTNINLTHNHAISGTKSITIHNALKQNDKVLLIQQRGGQKFIVLDKIY